MADLFRQLQQELASIDWRIRWRTWSLRVIFSALLMTLSEIVMWENPTAHTLADWIGRAVLYLALGSLLIDLTVRFQARGLPGLLLVSGLYGLVCSGLITRDGLASLPLGLIVHALGLQTGAAFYALLFFVAVMRGRPLKPIELAGAAGIGLLWGIWLKWYPAQPSVGWGAMTIETATTYYIVAAVICGGLLFVLAPNFRVIREQELELSLPEWVIVAVPLLIALAAGAALPGVLPVPSLVIAAVLGALMIQGLITQQVKHEPSLFGYILFSVTNPQTFIIVGLIFLLSGTAGALVVGDNHDSIIGAGTYVLVGAVGALWLPAVSALIGVRAFRRDASGEEQ